MCKEEGQLVRKEKNRFLLDFMRVILAQGPGYLLCIVPNLTDDLFRDSDVRINAKGRRPTSEERKNAIPSRFMRVILAQGPGYLLCIVPNLTDDLFRDSDGMRNRRRGRKERKRTAVLNKSRENKKIISEISACCFAIV